MSTRKQPEKKQKKEKIIKIKNKPQIITIKNKKTHIAVFLLQENESYEFAGKKRFDPSKSEISFRNGLYVITSDIASYTKGLRSFYFFDVKKGNQMYVGINSKIPVMTPKMLDKFIKRKLITQLTQNLMGSKVALPIMVFLVGAVMGALIGYIIGISV